MDDFTFPTTAAADTTEPLRLHHHNILRRRLPFPHFAASQLWFPSSCSPGAAAPVVAVASKDDVQVMAPDDDEEEEDEEEEEPTSDAGSRREEEEGKAEGGGRELLRGSGGGGGGGEGGGVAADEEKMDLLWENFNEELHALHRHRVGSCPRAGAAAAAAGLELSDTSDTESEPAVLLRGHGGCAPMLRASSRAGGTGHYRRTSSWVLLMKIFRRLFVIEKTISSSSSRHLRAR